MSGIYCITCKSNGKRYIGQTFAGFENRWKQHYKTAFSNKNVDRDKPLYRSIRKYGWENFTKEILCECKPDQLDEKEQFYIKEYKTLHPKGYNLTVGGNSGSLRSELTKKKMSDSLIKRHKLQPMTEESKNKIRESLLEYLQNNGGESLETKIKKSNSHRKRGHGLPRYVNVRVFPRGNVYVISKHPMLKYKQFDSKKECLEFLYLLEHRNEIKQIIDIAKTKLEILQKSIENDIEKINEIENSVNNLRQKIIESMQFRD